MRKILKKKKGLTLLELVIVLGLMGIVTAIIFGFVNTTQKKSKELEIRQELQHDGTMITESMMKNVLQTKNIDSLIMDDTTSTDINDIKEIIFDLGGIGTIKGKTVDKFKYRIHDGKLFFDVHAYSVSNPGVGDTATWTEMQIISENVKTVYIENKNIKTLLESASMPSESEINAAIKKEKSANLAIALDKDYYNKKIEHVHTIELSLRNAK
ncbi:MAG: prepilin-type N-terminal cleavage/methylation domain-containing protein [Sarcina sp.]